MGEKGRLVVSSSDCARAVSRRRRQLPEDVAVAADESVLRSGAFPHPSPPAPTSSGAGGVRVVFGSGCFEYGGFLSLLPTTSPCT